MPPKGACGSAPAVSLLMWTMPAWICFANCSARPMSRVKIEAERPYLTAVGNVDGLVHVVDRDDAHDRAEDFFLAEMDGGIDIWRRGSARRSSRARGRHR